jgi:two-component system, NarL family, sensor histidine kinase DesK
MMKIPDSEKNTKEKSLWSSLDYVSSETPSTPMFAVSSWQAEKYKYLPYLNLVYLIFLFVPLFLNKKIGATEILITLGSVAIFLPLHFMAYRKQVRHGALLAMAMAGLCYLVTPYNIGANTYLIYGVIAASYLLKARYAIAFLIASLALMLLQTYWLNQHPASVIITGILATPLALFSIFNRSVYQSNQRLKLSQEEVQRLAQTAERERIGRDLHDVLGHTMSLIVMKSELASRLFEHDPNAAIAQIREVEKVARDALGQIREAVSGMRLAGLEAELANARLSLLSADIHLHYQLAPIELSHEVETVLAFAVREAVTNIIRHSQAKRVEIELSKSKGNLYLKISDDGKADSIKAGNGLNGMRERIESLGGNLSIDNGPHGGLRLTLSCPNTEKNKP